VADNNYIGNDNGDVNDDDDDGDDDGDDDDDKNLTNQEQVEETLADWIGSRD